MKIPYWNDRWDDRAVGPTYVGINEVQPAEFNERDVKHYVGTDAGTTWYTEPITCVKIGGQIHPTKGFPASKVEACRRLGYTNLLIIYIEKPA